MYKLIGLITGLIMCGGVGSTLDPHNATSPFNMIAIVLSSGSIGFILGAIADGVNK